MALPEGYVPFHRSGPFLDLVGPLYERLDGAALLLGLRVEARHCNRRGLAHGGLMMTLADLVLGYNLVRVGGHGGGITVSLTTDFAGSARVGDWLEARADVQKATGSVAFANCYISVGDRRIVRASGIFHIPAPNASAAP
ncbi:MAG: PaaI family thioesterase [Alphaproteobacteria bacterium]|nr:PaaI family thioesterase [Alphaproteobacteria bacterium]MCW5738601.1 PaaI family thioesterase [Alphaproteobacteria bacterium]